MARSMEDLSILNCILFWFVVLVPLYPYPVWGSPYQSADHYWPMYNITDGILDDVEGSAHTVVYNGGKIIEVPQLGHALSFDGQDDWVDTGGFNADCVTDPSRCNEGFTLTFWLKVLSSGYILSSGSFTNHRNGPGFQLYYKQSLKRFKFLVETLDKKWMLLIHEDVEFWTHMAFTWHHQNGLRYYEDGNLSTFTDEPVLLSPLRQQNYTPVITLARPSTLKRLNEFGRFEMSQFAIWLKELSAEDIAGVYKNGVIYQQDFVLCCYFKGVNPCVTNPCHDADQCRQISKFSEKKCICPSVNLRMKTCPENITGECEDKSTGCRDFAAQSYYCKHRKMREICPRSCGYCATPRLSTTLQPTLSTGSTSMSRIARQSKDPVTVAPSRSPHANGTPSTPKQNVFRTTRRRLPRGRSCEDLQCPFYAQCIQINRGDAECKCPQTCNKERKPVCGTNDKTYFNECVMKMEACQLGELIKRKAHGFCGVRFITATHYLPMNFTTSNKLVDMRGNASGEALNGVKVSIADQIGQVLSLDGKDDFIELKGIRDRCIVDPTNCTEGLSVAFWIKYTKGKFIISSGGYVTSNNGPGFRFICQGCAGPQAHTSGTFLLELSTETAKWKIHLDSIPYWWFHFAFTWNRNQGLKFYKNGKLVLSTRNPEKVRRYNDAPDEMLTIGKANSLMAMFARNSLGEFSIGHLVIWTYELSDFNVEIAFMSALATTIKTLFCCKQLKADPCIMNPCHDGATCQRMDRGDKYQCICPDIDHRRRCIGAQKLSEHCEDKSERCNKLASQDGYCDYHWRRMKDICPKACKLCGTTAQAPGVSTSMDQLTTRVSSTFTSSTIERASTSSTSRFVVSSTISQVSSTFISATTTRISPSFTSSTIIRTSTSFTSSAINQASTSFTSSTITQASTSYTSSFAVKSSSKSAWSTSHFHLTKATTASSFAHITSVQPLLSSAVPSQGKDTLTCKINNVTCVCFNCEEARKNGKICCMDLGDIKNIRQGVTMRLLNITVQRFHHKVKAVSRIIAEVVRDSCLANASLCVTGEKMSGAPSERQRRSLQGQIIKNKHSSDRIRTKREALRPDINPFLTNISDVDAIIYSISSKGGQSSSVETEFYVTVTSLRNGTNQTVVLDGKGLLQILRNKRHTLENILNITIASFTASHQSSELGTTSSHQASLMPNSSQGSHNTQTTLPTREVAVPAVPTTAVLARLENGEIKKGFTQELLILIICAGVGGVILLTIVLAFIFTRFYRQRKGEFVPDKSYPNSHNKQNGEANGEDAENIASFIDPYTQITDVPHKPTRGHSSGGGPGGGGKKQRKPMGVKVTYKPPEWD